MVGPLVKRKGKLMYHRGNGIWSTYSEKRDREKTTNWRAKDNKIGSTGGILGGGKYRHTHDLKSGENPTTPIIKRGISRKWRTSFVPVKKNHPKSKRRRISHWRRKYV